VKQLILAKIFWVKLVVKMLASQSQKEEGWESYCPANAVLCTEAKLAWRGVVVPSLRRLELVNAEAAPQLAR
jgi:hypothetical protein